MNVSASVNGVYNISSGLDNSDGLNDVFLDTEIARLSASDNDRIQSNGNWPIGNYDETKYIEFSFNPNIPSDAIIESVSISHEYYKTVILAGAKLEVWNGTNFVDYPINLPTSGGTANETSQTIDIFNTVNTANQINQLLVRFLAYRANPASSIKTSHDLMVLNIAYSIPEIVIPPTSPEQELEVSPEPDPTDETPIPDPIADEEPIEPVEPVEPTDPIGENLPAEDPEDQQSAPEEEIIPDPTPEDLSLSEPVKPAPVENTDPVALPQNNSGGVVPVFILNSENNQNQIKDSGNNTNQGPIDNSTQNESQPATSVFTNQNTDVSLTQPSIVSPGAPNPVEEKNNSEIDTEDPKIPESNSDIDPNILLSSAAIAGSGSGNNKNWWLFVMFAIIGVYLIYRIWQKPKSQKS